MTDSSLLQQARALRDQLETLHATDPAALADPDLTQELDSLRLLLTPPPPALDGDHPEQDLKRSLDQLSYVQAVTQLSFYEYNFDRQEGRSDRYQKELFGFQRLLTPTEFVSRIHPDNQEVMRKLLLHEGDIPAGSTVKHSYRYLHPDKGWRWMEFSGHYLELPNGERVVRGFDRDVTQENKRWQEEQKNLLQELELALQVDELGYALTDLKTGTLERWNSHFLRHCQLQSAMETNLWEWMETHLHPEDREQVRASIDAALAQPGRYMQVLNRLFDADQQLRWIEISGYIQVIDDAPKVFTLSRDLTQQVQQEEERTQLIAQLKREIEQGQRARELSRSGYWSWHIPSGAIQWSPEVYETYQIPHDQPMTFESFQKAVHPSDWPHLEARIQETLETSKGYEIKHRVVTPQGDIRWVEAKGALRLNDEGQPLELYGVVTDVTERHLAQQEREKLLQRLQLAMKTAQFGFAESCLDTGERLIDNAYAQLQELAEPDEIPFEKMMQRVHPDDRPMMERLLLEDLPQLPHGTPLTFVYRFQMKNGTWQWREASTTLTQREGKLWRIGVIRDVTEFMQQQEELRRHERFAALGQLAAEINHDLKQPLSILELRLHQLQDLLAPEQREKGLRSLEAASSALEHAKSIMTRTLEVARAEDEFQNQPLSAILHQVAELFTTTFRHQNIRFECQCPWADHPESEPLVSLNRKEMIQVFQNLFSNSVDAIVEQQEQHGSASGEIRVVFSEQPSTLKVCLFDTGIGISAEVRERMFDQFFTTKGKDGSGLGLSMCRRILQQHQGSLEAFNRVDLDHGAHFCLVLPKAAVPAS